MSLVIPNGENIYRRRADSATEEVNVFLVRYKTNALILYIFKEELNMNLKKIISILIVLTMSGLMLFGCNSSGSNNSTASQSPAPEASAPTETEAATEAATEEASGEMLKIGILQLIEHVALDSAREGFIVGLSEAGYVQGENIEIEILNAQGDQSNLSTMSARLVQNKSDLILAIATNAAQSVVMETNDIPVLFTAVTDPVSAQIVNSIEEPGYNSTGTSDLTPVAKQMELITKVLPDAKTVGVIYTSSEINSEIQANLAIKAAADLGLTCEIATVSNLNDVPQVLEALTDKIDVLYVPTDNTLASAYPLVVDISTNKGIPVVGGEEAAVDAGALMTDGIDYFNLGRQTGAMAAKILSGEAETATMPVEYLDETNTVINTANAAALGIEIPADILASAYRLVEE